jgi:hypothetical protein
LLQPTVPNVGYAMVKNQCWNLKQSSQLLQLTVPNTICQQALVSLAYAQQKPSICQQALACAQQTPQKNCSRPWLALSKLLQFVSRPWFACSKLEFKQDV